MGDGYCACNHVIPGISRGSRVFDLLHKDTSKAQEEFISNKSSLELGCRRAR